jgi:hypothetical protein
MAGIGNVKYRVLTKIEDSKITQELQQLNDLTTEVYEAITRKIIDTQDAQIVQALKNLGWTPPANKED